LQRFPNWKISAPAIFEGGIMDSVQMRSNVSTERDSDIKALEALNNLYIQCVVQANADQFESILGEDFLCSTPDGAILDRQGFLWKTRTSPPLKYMDTDGVRIRLMGDVAIIHAQTTFASRDGAPGVGRYTDVWAKREGRWVAVAAHVTRLAG
jgi:hypothetical protein